MIEYPVTVEQIVVVWADEIDGQPVGMTGVCVMHSEGEFTFDLEPEQARSLAAMLLEAADGATGGAKENRAARRARVRSN